MQTQQYQQTGGSSAGSTCRFDDECKEVVESFVFLDEALDKYPGATIVRLSEVANIHDNDDCHQVLPGMGTIPSSTAARIILDPDDSNWTDN